MAGDEGGGVAEWPELGGAGLDEVRVIAHREVGAADRTLEQHVADDRQLRRRMVKHDMAGRMAGAVIDVERQFTHRHGVAILQPAVRFERHTQYTVAGTVLFQPVRSEEHTSELQSLMRISYAVFCLKQKNTSEHSQANTASTARLHFQ